MSEAVDRAMAGLAWLESFCPAEAIDAVDIGSLDAECFCVLDQIFGDYLSIVEIAKAGGMHYEAEEPLPGSWLVDHGFDFAVYDDQAMTEAWRAALAERLVLREGIKR